MIGTSFSDENLLVFSLQNNPPLLITVNNYLFVKDILDIDAIT